MADGDRPNILEGIEIGSTVFGDTRRVGATVLTPGITAFNTKIQKVEDAIKSNSQFVHNAALDEANLSISGSVGVSAVSQIEAGLSASYSNETADTSNSLSIEMQRFVTAGIEYVDFDDVSAEEFIAALKGAPKNPEEDDTPHGINARMVNVIDAYDALINHPEKDDAEAIVNSAELANWIKARQSFLKAAGDLVVIGVVWGAWGGVKLSFDAVSMESMWKAGIQGTFSYASPGVAVGVSGGYGHTSLTNEQKKSGRVDRISHGNAIENLVTKWEETLNGILTKNVEAIGKTTIGDLGSSPTPSLPDIPSRTKPKASGGVAKKLSGIKDLAGLQALAKASAYDAYVKDAKKRGEKPESLDAFLNNATAENDLNGLQQTLPGVDLDDDAPHEDQPDQVQGGQGGQILHARRAAPAAAGGMLGATQDTFSDFIAVGAWMVPWGQIFPWLAEPQFNAIPKGAFQSSLFRLRMLVSDLTTLARSYRHLTVMGIRNDSPELDPEQIANAFLKAQGNAKELMLDHLREPGGRYKPAELEERMKSVLKRIAPKYRKIYSTWVKNPNLRKCELGLGMTVKWDEWGEEHFVSPHALNYNSLLSHEVLWKIAFKESSFDSSVKNYEAFASNIKIIPVIIPNGDIVCFVSWIDDRGEVAAGLLCASRKSKGGLFLSSVGGDGTQIKNMDMKKTKDGGALTLESDGRGFSASTYGKIKNAYTMVFMSAYPIPFKAAKDITWIGSSSGVGISDMQGNIRAMRDRLSSLTNWSFGDEKWRDHDETDPIFGLQSLEPVYIGLIAEPAQFKNLST